ncbi:MAG: Asp-tRNA(Asn)/Glu-tRNA(Gln) amidotransferase subunit GatC [Clostridia bacterium]|nr:Asp-tRNA(Asn)/Glu-tRNA(Gln) amidotransferase subunit GatC [Clostridia bacterium]
MSVSKEQVKHIANLARLKLSDEELEKYTNSLSDIVDFAESLNEVDVSNVEPTAHILKIQNVFRKDELKESFDREELFKNAPTKESGCISVPKVVE